MKIRAIIAGLCAALPAMAGCGEEPPRGPELAIRDAWARPAVVTADADAAPVNSAAYFVIENRGGSPDRLLGVGHAGAARVELHESYVDENGIARMRPVEAVEVPAGGEARLAPGGLHVMLMGLEASLAEGDSVDLSLRFEATGELDVRAVVRSL